MKYNKDYFKKIAKKWNEQYNQKKSANDPKIDLDIEDYHNEIVLSVTITIINNEKGVGRFRLPSESLTEKKIMSIFTKSIQMCIYNCYNEKSDNVSELVESVFWGNIIINNVIKMKGRNIYSKLDMIVHYPPIFLNNEEKELLKSIQEKYGQYNGLLTSPKWLLKHCKELDESEKEVLKKVDNGIFQMQTEAKLNCWVDEQVNKMVESYHKSAEKKLRYLASIYPKNEMHIINIPPDHLINYNSSLELIDLGMDNYIIVN